MVIDPHPRSTTAKGGKIIANNTCKQFIYLSYSQFDFYCSMFSRNPLSAALKLKAKSQLAFSCRKITQK